MATKWTSTIVSRFLSLNIAPAIRSCPAATGRIFAHSRSYASADKSLPPEELEKKKQEAKMRHAEKRRLRYQSDPEYRERIQRANKKLYAVKSADPEFLEGRRRQMNEKYATDPEFRKARSRYVTEKYASDPEYCEKTLRKTLLQRKERFANDLAFREKETQRATKDWRAKKAKLEQDPEAYRLLRNANRENTKVLYLENAEYKWNQIVGARHNRSARFRDEVVWKCHELVVYPIKMDYGCATCNRKNWGGLKT